MTTESNYEHMKQMVESAARMARERGISVITATQPCLGGPGLTPEQILGIAKQPLVIDYVGLIIPSPSRALVPVKE